MLLEPVSRGRKNKKVMIRRARRAGAAGEPTRSSTVIKRVALDSCAEATIYADKTCVNTYAVLAEPVEFEGFAGEAMQSVTSTEAGDGPFGPGYLFERSADSTDLLSLGALVDQGKSVSYEQEDDVFILHDVDLSTVGGTACGSARGIRAFSSSSRRRRTPMQDRSGGGGRLPL
jgi:hypothetical protein